MHTIKEILQNQNNFKGEIFSYLKNDFKNVKKDLSRIETIDVRIKKEKEKLLKATKKIKVIKEIDKLFISEINTSPKFYAWWDEENQEVQIKKYTDN